MSEEYEGEYDEQNMAAEYEPEPEPEVEEPDAEVAEAVANELFPVCEPTNDEPEGCCQHDEPGCCLGVPVNPAWDSFMAALPDDLKTLMFETGILSPDILQGWSPDELVEPAGRFTSNQVDQLQASAELCGWLLAPNKPAASSLGGKLPALTPHQMSALVSKRQLQAVR